MRSQRESRLDDQELMKVVEKYTWRDYPAAIAIMIFLITLVILLVAMSFFVMSNAKKALVVIAAMMCSPFVRRGHRFAVYADYRDRGEQVSENIRNVGRRSFRIYFS